MLQKLWKERPPTPVILAWMTAGVLVVALLSAVGWGAFRLVTYLAG